MGCAASTTTLETQQYYYNSAKKHGHTIQNNLLLNGLEKDGKGNFKQIHNYKIGKCIGKGAYGEVYQCWDRLERSGLHKKGLPCAMKLVQMQKNSLREITILSKLDHPNIIHLKEYIENHQEKTIYLFMECLDSVLCSCSPTGVLTEPPWQEDRAKTYFAQLFDALEYLHAMDIAHRDIKPENILFTIDKTCVKMIDFGESRHFKTGDDSCKQATGTPQYHSPELAEGTGSKNSDKARDIWALGVTLYLVLVGKIPFGEGEQCQMHLWAKISVDPLVFPKGAELSANAKHLLGRMLEKNQTLRITPSEGKDSSWFTGCTEAPRLTGAVSMTEVEEFQTPPDENTEIASPFTPLVLDRNPLRLAERRGMGCEVVCPTPSHERVVRSRSTTTTVAVPSPGGRLFRGKTIFALDATAGSESSQTQYSPRTPAVPENASTGSFSTSSSRRTSSHILPKTPKITTVVSIPALDTTTPTSSSSPSSHPTPRSSPKGASSPERTPVSDILTIMSQDYRSKLKLLIVDDVFQQRDIISKMMKELVKPQIGVTCTIDTAEDGDEAVRAVLNSKEDPYTLIIMDIHMPRVSGIAASMEIRMAEQQQGRLEVPIFGITSEPSLVLKDLCKKAGMQAVLVKPILPNVLRDVLTWANIPCNKSMSDIFTATNGWHSSCKRHLEQREASEGSQMLTVDWWYTVDIDDDEVKDITGDSPGETSLPPPRNFL